MSARPPKTHPWLCRRHPHASVSRFVNLINTSRPGMGESLNHRNERAALGAGCRRRESGGASCSSRVTTRTIKSHRASARVRPLARTARASSACARVCVWPCAKAQAKVRKQNTLGRQEACRRPPRLVPDVLEKNKPPRALSQYN